MLFSLRPKFRKWDVALKGILSGIPDDRKVWYSSVVECLNKVPELTALRPFPSSLSCEALSFAEAFQLITILDVVFGRGYVLDPKSRAEFMFQVVLSSVNPHEKANPIYKRYLGSPKTAKFGDFELVERARAPFAADLSGQICSTSPAVIAPIIEGLSIDLSFLTMLTVATEFGDNKGVNEIHVTRIEWAKTLQRRP